MRLPISASLCGCPSSLSTFLGHGKDAARALEVKRKADEAIMTRAERDEDGGGAAASGEEDDGKRENEEDEECRRVKRGRKRRRLEEETSEEAKASLDHILFWLVFYFCGNKMGFYRDQTGSDCVPVSRKGKL